MHLNIATGAPKKYNDRRMSLNHKKTKELVDRLPLKRSAVAAECGVRPQTLTRILNGLADPSRAVLLHLVRILGVNESMLLSSTDDEGRLPAA